MIDKEKYPVPYDVLSIYGVSFSKVKKGSTEFWTKNLEIYKKIAEEKPKISLNAAVNFAFTILKQKMDVDIWPIFIEVLKSETECENVTQVIDLDPAFQVLWMLQESTNPNKLELMNAIG